MLWKSLVLGFSLYNRSLSNGFALITLIFPGGLENEKKMLIYDFRFNIQTYFMFTHIKRSVGYNSYTISNLYLPKLPQIKVGLVTHLHSKLFSSAVCICTYLICMEYGWIHLKCTTSIKYKSRTK